MRKVLWRRLWQEERGFTLIEVIAAVFLLGTVVVGTMQILGVTARSSARSEGNAALLELVKAQVETIKAAPFEEDASNYPLAPAVATGFTVSWEATGAGPVYATPDGTTLANVVQTIEVVAEGDNSSLTMTFYKIRME